MQQSLRGEKDLLRDSQRRQRDKDTQSTRTRKDTKGILGTSISQHLGGGKGGDTTRTGTKRNQTKNSARYRDHDS